VIVRKNRYRLFAATQGGSMIVEAAFGFTTLPLTVKDIDWKDLGWKSKALASINPLGQIPTLELPDGTIMSESAAIILHLADQVPKFPLVPSPKSTTRPEFLRWLEFLTSALYPTYTYGDVPVRWVGQPKDKGAGKALRASTDEHRKVLLKVLETQVRGPWFLGRDLSALDLYVWVLATWRPGREWYAQHCPKLLKVADALEEHPVCRRVAARNRR
jgi:GST-like protein